LQRLKLFHAFHTTAPTARGCSGSAPRQSNEGLNDQSMFDQQKQRAIILYDIYSYNLTNFDLHPAALSIAPEPNTSFIINS
jgi:hypothetical protein